MLYKKFSNLRASFANLTFKRITHRSMKSMIIYLLYPYNLNLVYFQHWTNKKGIVLYKPMSNRLIGPSTLFDLNYNI